MSIKHLLVSKLS